MKMKEFRPWGRPWCPLGSANGYMQKLLKVRSHSVAMVAATVPQQMDSIVTNGFIHMTIFTCSNGNGNASKWVWKLFCAAAAVAW